MESSDDTNTVEVGESDGLDEVALASVDKAIEAVENQTIEATPEASAPEEQPPRDVIPELDDVENTEEMVEVLLTVGEERSRRDDVKGALAAFN